MAVSVFLETPKKGQQPKNLTKTKFSVKSAAIKRVITPSLTVSDNATPELKEIRNKLKVLEASLNQKVVRKALLRIKRLSRCRPHCLPRTVCPTRKALLP